MHAKTPFLSQTRLPDAGTIAPAARALPDKPLSAAFGKALGGQPAKPHLAEAAGGKSARSALKVERTSGPAHDRAVPVKPIAPRSGHR
jgi:hypothetical protein